jgi:hypothetical protein
MAKLSPNLRQLAFVGAQTRLAELQREQQAIWLSFPELRVGRVVDKGSQRKQPKRRRRVMSAAQRKAVSARMKKYWAGRKKAEGKEK